MKISVVGTGYVGLVAGVCFAESGNSVLCIDIDESKINKLKDGDPVIYEPGLETLLKKNIKAGRINFSSKIEDISSSNDVIFLAVGTPTDDKGVADLSFLFNAVKSISKHIKKGSLVVNKCTAPVGTVDKIRDIIIQNSGFSDFYIASNPEFLKEGTAVQDFLYPDRVVIGVNDDIAANTLKTLYEPFVLNGNPIHLMDIRSAELSKYACNCFLATKISFMNDIAELCERVGADIEEVRTSMSTDPRIGRSFLYSGLGYGGSCLPKDVKALISTSQDAELELSLVKAADSINLIQRERFLAKILKFFNNDVKDKIFAVWGLAFKPQTDDMRDAPSIYIIEELVKRGAVVKASDPIAISNAKKIIKGDVQYFEDHLLTLKDSDALLLITEWNEYRSFEGANLREHFAGTVVFDGRNIWHSEDIKKAGYTYYGVGRPVKKELK
jgi:UDPglucose 6-dehydrogenase